MEQLIQIRNLVALSLAMLFGCTVAAGNPASSATSPFRNGDFEASSQEAPSFWQAWSGETGSKVTCELSAIAHKGKQSAMVEVAPDANVSWYGYGQVVNPVQYGQTYLFSCWIKTEQVTDGVGAYAGIELLDPDKVNERVCFIDSDRLTGTNDWTLIKTCVFIPSGVNTIRINLSLHGRGRAYFDDTKLELLYSAGPLPDAKVALKLTNQPAKVQSKFMGFGVEDDPFLLSGKNLEFNINEEDLSLRELRSFLWWDAFNPSRDMKTFDYDTVGMKSIYTMLSIYQTLGIPVVITDTHWSWSKAEFPYNEKHVERGVDIYLKLLDYLIRERGFTCIRYATITNEPNYFWEALGGTPASFAKANKVFHEKLQSSSLKDHLQLIGADSGQDQTWLRRTIQESDSNFGAYSMHFYLPTKQYPLFRELTQAMVKTVRNYSKPLEGHGNADLYKPALVLEFGHLPDKDEMGNLADTLRYYEAALWTANADIEVLNQGAAGALLWCLHSMYYGEGLMVPGLWDFKDSQWAIRPVYYSHGLFMRLARPGMVPLKLEASAESCEFNAAALKDAQGHVTLFLLNLAGKPLEVNLAGMAKGKYQVYILSRDTFEATKTRSDAERLDCLATGPASIGSTYDLIIGPESFVVLRQI
jgi:hypothetical protein